LDTVLPAPISPEKAAAGERDFPADERDRPFRSRIFFEKSRPAKDPPLFAV